MFGVVETDLLHTEATLVLQGSSDGAVVAGNVFHNLTMHGNNKNGCWSIVE